MNTTCPNCGANVGHADGNAAHECPYCGTLLSSVSRASKQSAAKHKKSSSYIELAETAYNGKDWKGLKKYADLALEQNVSNSKLWWYKTLAEAKMSVNVRDRIPLIIECGEKCIQYAQDKDRATADISWIYIDLAIDKLDFMQQWPETGPSDEVILEYEEDIITLIKKVTEYDAVSYCYKLQVLSQSWFKHIKRHFGSGERGRELVRIYKEIFPLYEDEKEKELKLFEQEVLYGGKKPNNWLGCFTLTCIILTIYYLIRLIFS